ncbi:MAG: amidohydrolase [Phycisphaerales bacterium]
MMQRRAVMRVCVAAVVVLCARGPWARGQEVELAELVVVNANVWTGDAEHARAEALAVSGGRFVFVGDEAGARAYVGEGTRVVDAGGRRVVPGMVDAHTHPVNAGLQRRAVDLRGAKSRAELLGMVRAEAGRKKEGEWVLGAGWSSEGWEDARRPSAEELEEAGGGRPVLLRRMDGHMLVASVGALERAGITRDGPADPAGGKIGRREGGAPTGEVFDEAMGMVEGLVPDVSAEETRALVREALREANSYGVTALGAIETERGLEDVLGAMDRAGELTVRVRGTVWSDAGTVEEWREVLEWTRAHRVLSGNVRLIGFKGYMDGSLGSRTAWMFEPYLDDAGDAHNCGMALAMAGNGDLKTVIEMGARMGLQPAVHAIGDRANATLLNWYEGLGEATRLRVRARVEHAQHTRAEDVARFAGLHVVASVQPLHKADDGRYAERRIGAERCATSYAFREMLDSGAVVAFGSDWPVVSVSPWEGVWAAVSARTLDGKEFVKEQRVGVEEALRAYTSSAAWALHSEGEFGVIREGMGADFAVLDRDVLEVGAEEIRGTRAVLTVMEGRVVWEGE